MIDAPMLAALTFPEWSPALFTIPEFEAFGRSFGPLPLRWYAIGYIAGIALGLWYMHKLLRTARLHGGTRPFAAEVLDDFLFWAIVGIIVGGRLGYVLFYMLPFPDQRALLIENPARILAIWEGGMAFHGGLLGVTAAMLYIAVSRKVALFKLTDLAACAAPIGIGLVRVANFLNAELFGRPTNASIGMVFPEGKAGGPGGPPDAYNWETKEWVYSGDEVARHPSQLYEAGLEGFLLFILLGVLVWRFGILRRPGLATGVFLVGYGLGRTIAENFRMPDDHIGFLGFLPFDVTMGMILSAPMYLGGAYLIWRALNHPAEGGPPDQASEALEDAPAKRTA